MIARYPRLVPTLLLALAATALAADVVVVEDWSAPPVGTKGIPPPWQKQRWGSPNYDFTVVEDSGRKVLHLKSAGDSSNISKEIKGKVDLKETPILEWSWKVVTLPRGGDSRKKETDDQAAQIYVTWPRFPEAVRSQIIGYIWDTTAPVGSIIKSQKTGTVTYVVVRSGPADLGQWLTEQRNVREDFKKIYGEEPDNPAILSFGIDSDDTKSTAESYMGPILFKKP
ncbi:MAG TPA: DUF3047 domain-containing protein [Methylomirabilota bacterium]|jgi:hypothetical protein|nr:DUF3047 domain-containing protein [Methylomirabilota bacterium]